MRRATEVEVELICDDEVITLSIRDNGVGFDSQQASQGLGRLGLLSMKERVRLVRGTLTVSTAPAAAPILKSVSRFQVARMPKPRVLLADDHSLVLEGFRRILDDQCELVGMVEDGRALLEAAARVHPDIVILTCRCRC